MRIFKEVYQEAGFKNTVTTKQLYEKYEEKAEDPKTLEDLTREYEQVEKLIQVYFANMKEFLSAIDEGRFHISPDELTEKQKEAGVEQILSLYRKVKQNDGESIIGLVDYFRLFNFCCPHFYGGLFNETME